MSKQSPRTWSRRELMQLTLNLAAVGLTTSLTPDLIHGQTKTDFSGVTLDYWNTVGTQNQSVRQISQAVIAAFQQRTGAKVNVIWEDPANLIGPKYLTSFESGKRPTVFDATGRWTGALRPFVRPLNDFMEKEWEPGARNGMDWALPMIEAQNRGFTDPKTIYDLPFGLVPQAAILTRKDHWEKAGFNWTLTWPILDSDYFLAILVGLRDQGRIRYPTEMYGTVSEALDKQIGGWVRSLDPEASTMLNADWTQSTCDSPAWREAVQFFVNLGGKFKLSSPGWPETTDRDAVEQFIRGEKTIIHASVLHLGRLAEKLPARVADRTIVWGLPFPLKGGKAGGQGFVDFMTLSIVKQDGPDAALKERAAWEFVKEWFLKENQVAYSRAAALCVGTDLWPVAFDPRDRYMQVVTKLIVNGGVWPNHPQAAEILHHRFGRHLRRAMEGAPVEQELADYAREVNEILQA